jgi:transposase
LCADPFHVVKWATVVLDQVRREVWNAARKHGQAGLVRELKGAVCAVEEPGDLTGRQRGKLAWIARVNDRLYRAYLLKEEPSAGVSAQGRAGEGAAGGVTGLGPAMPHPAFVKLARAITQHRAAIQAALTHGLSNGLVESVNTKIRLLTPGWRSASSLPTR